MSVSLHIMTDCMFTAILGIINCTTQSAWEGAFSRIWKKGEQLNCGKKHCLHLGVCVCVCCEIYYNIELWVGI